MTDEESLRLAIDEEVSLATYDPQWREAFVAERDRLLALFPGAILEIEHIGSTAVPGMPAKPIADVPAGVASIEAADALVEPLCRAGYATSAEFNASLVDRRWLMRWASGRRTHHLHIVVHGGQAWAERVAFRDALAGDEAIAERYAGLKRRLAGTHRLDREAYTEAKGDFVRAVLDARAGFGPALGD